jgi:hypothetical protein
MRTTWYVFSPNLMKSKRPRKVLSSLLGLFNGCGSSMWFQWFYYYTKGGLGMGGCVIFQKLDSLEWNNPKLDTFGHKTLMLFCFLRV